MVIARVRVLAGCLLCLLGMGCSSPARPAPPSPENLKTQAAEYCRAVLAEEVEKVADLSYTEPFRDASREQVVAALKAVAADRKEDGARISALTVSDPLPTREAQGVLYAALTLSEQMTRPEGTFARSGVLLAISKDQGQTWRFLDCTSFAPGRASLQALIPGLPPDLPLPEPLPTGKVTFTPSGKPAPPSAAAELTWLVNLEEALKQALAQKRPILLFFTAETSITAQANEDMLFRRREIRDLVKGHVLVKLYTDQVPEQFYAGKVTAEQRQEDAVRNRNLQRDQFHTQAVPLYVLMAPQVDGSWKALAQHEGILDTEVARTFLSRGAGQGR